MLGRTRQDRLFARFVERGDVHALGEVFDATAPELLRIAAHLVGSREQAGDLVQNAFLIALEKRAEFASERRVLPWLCGIVAKLALNERRRALRRFPGSERAGPEDPRAAAEAREFRAAFAHALAGLPEPYRPVLELHLERGLDAGEIGTALGRPSGTVRTQIVRGLEGLRRRLPRGFVAGVLAAPNGVELGAARAAVLRRAAESLPGSGPTPAAAVGPGLLVSGAGTMKSLVVLCALCLALVPFGLRLASSSTGAPRGQSSEPSLAARRPEPGEASRAEPVAPLSAGERVPPGTQPATAATEGSLEVLVRWANDGAPARAQALDVMPTGEAFGELHPRRVITDDAGRALFVGLRPGVVSVQASTGVRCSAEVVAGVQGTVDLALEGFPLLGQVVDDQGAPVADADVWVSSELRYPPERAGAVPFHGQYGERTLRTDAEGRFETRIAPVQCLAAFKEGHGPSCTVSPFRGARPSPERPASVVLRLQAEGGSLAVTVRGADGAPLVDALVLAGPEVPYLTLDEDLSTPPALRASTDETGRAWLSPLSAGRIPVEVRAAGHGPWRGEVEIPVGRAAGLEVALAAGAVVEGIVRDAGGAPLAEALVRHDSAEQLRASLATTDAQGAYRLEGLPDGALTLVASHEDWGSATSELTLTAGGTSRWDVRMPPRAAITGLVLDDVGQPASGADVFAYGPAGHARTHADAAGRFTLMPLAPGQAYELRAEVRARSGGLAIAERTAVPAGAEVELRPATDDVPSARLRGRVLRADGAPAAGYEVDTAPLDGEPGARVPLDDDGTFELGPWPPARLRLSVFRNGGRVACGDFGVHEMLAGATVDVGDLVLPLPGSARIRIAEGEAERGMASLFRDGLFVHARPVTEGVVAWDELPPGDYAVCVIRGGASPVTGMVAFAVRPGQVAEPALTVAVARRRELRVERPSGCTNAALVLRATAAGGRDVWLDWTLLDSDEASTRIDLPDGVLELHLASEDGCRGVAPVSADTAPIVVVLAREE